MFAHIYKENKEKMLRPHGQICIGFLIPMFCVKESEISRIYDFVNPGYLEDKDRYIQQNFIFKAYDTITPAQISRWSNVCETYRYLLQMNGVDEALADVSEKVDLIDEEMERVNAGHQNFFATVIAVFGLTSIVASVLQIVDYVQPGDPTMLLWSGISGTGILITLIAWILMMWRNRR